MFFVLVLFESAKIAYYSTICKYLKPYNLYINKILAYVHKHRIDMQKYGIFIADYKYTKSLCREEFWGK